LETLPIIYFYYIIGNFARQSDAEACSGKKQTLLAWPMKKILLVDDLGIDLMLTRMALEG
jgi:hypothetical protein